ncbi:hypothetical protein [Vibrio antiquarius]|uniref:hypothetical protein n=1 Tax=Vibrio antiquarius (strain Ex25) TaxID=150340 RepID=UPI002659CA96|nr:hypothetical protein [Vibrio antiquarius]MCS0022785.1 hypothetical protein [Vibrio antiquarius]
MPLYPSKEIAQKVNAILAKAEAEGRFGSTATINEILEVYKPIYQSSGSDLTLKDWALSKGYI